SLDLARNLVRVAVAVDAADAIAAQEHGSGMLRSAFHAAEVGTPTWSVEWVEVSTQKQDDDDTLDLDDEEHLAPA
ncbi:MAG: hypothetical protein ABIS21_04330, partial [Acidimicrobiales bacterium]